MNSFDLRSQTAYNNIIPRFWASFLFTMPFLFRQVEPWLQWLLATAIIAVGLWPIIEESLKKKFSRYTLMSVAISALYLFSFLEFLLSKKPTLYFDYTAIITTLLSFGLILEQLIFDQISYTFTGLIKSLPESAMRLSADGKVHKVKIERLTKSDCVRVSRGEVVPVDGIIMSGETIIDESSLTGKMLPVKKCFGEKIYAGSVNLKSPIVIQAKRVGKHTLIAKIAKILSKALESELPNKSIIENRKRLFIPFVILSSVFFFLLWTLFSGLDSAMLVFASILLVASPKALEISSSIITLQLLQKGLSAGVLIGSCEAINRILHINMLIFDKTGILTKAQPVVFKALPADGIAEKELMQYAILLEAESEHPIAHAIVEQAKKYGMTTLPVKNIKEVQGLGIKGEINGVRCLIGDEELVSDIDNHSELTNEAERYRKEGYIVIFVARERQILGIIVIDDPIDEQVKEAISQLKKEKIKLFCLSGDRKSTVSLVAKKLNLDHFLAEQTPEEKIAEIKKLKKKKYHIALLGDAAKDADTLQYADVGIATGFFAGDEMPASVTLMKPDLMGVLRLRTLGKKAYRFLKQNLIFSTSYNALFITLAAFGLFTPITATCFMIASIVFISLLSLRIRK